MSSPWPFVAAAGAQLAGGILGSGAAKDAAKDQKQLAYDIYNQNVALQQPWRLAGINALNQLGALYGIPAFEIKDPRYFDAAAYLSQNPDVAAHPYYRSNPLEHYQRFGKSEGRDFTSTLEQPEYSGMEGFFESPGYQFRLDEGQKALDRAMRSRGRTGGGAYDKALQRFAQGEASKEFGNYQNMLLSLAGYGPMANQSISQSGNVLGQQAGRAIGDLGEARASGYMGIGKTVGNMLNMIPYMQPQTPQQPQIPQEPTVYIA